MKHDADFITKVQELAAFLCGTCKNPDPDLLEQCGLPRDADDNGTLGIALELHGEIFLCAGCGWWCENSEMADISGGDQLCAEWRGGGRMTNAEVRGLVKRLNDAKCVEQHEPGQEAPSAEETCDHDWVYTGIQYGGDDESYHGEGRVYCSKCGADGDA